jgi:hypothetical protein
MPIEKWGAENAPELLPGYAVFCTRPRPRVPFVYHAMLVAGKQSDPQFGTQIRIFDMRPPMRFAGPKDVHRLTPKSFVGWIVELDHLEVLESAEWLASRAPAADGTDQFARYSLNTHEVEISDPNDDGGTIVQVRCSCASFC